MAHRLDPPEGLPALAPEEIARILRAEFAHVEADAQAGAEVVASMLRQFERMRAPQRIIEEHRRLLPSAIRFVVADVPDFVDAYLCFTALPGQGFLVGYHSARHEAASAALLRRCTRALGYEITLV
jgi:hypothetical protein